jgi:hypothetical protein
MMEAVQTYLPSRVSSNLDFYTNAAGCALGGLIGVLGARKLLDTSHLYRLRQRWFAQHASQGLVLLALWPLAQIYPQASCSATASCCPSCRNGCRICGWTWISTWSALCCGRTPN